MVFDSFWNILLVKSSVICADVYQCRFLIFVVPFLHKAKFKYQLYFKYVYITGRKSNQYWLFAEVYRQGIKNNFILKQLKCLTRMGSPPLALLSIRIYMWIHVCISYPSPNFERISKTCSGGWARDSSLSLIMGGLLQTNKTTPQGGLNTTLKERT